MDNLEEIRKQNFYFVLLVSIVCGFITFTFAQNCTHPNPGFNYTYNFSCPINTTCVVDDRFDPPNQLLTAIPVGCCPDNLPQACFRDDAFMGIDGCCRENQACCYTAAPLQRRWIGCAAGQEQCCFNQICPEGYFCCATSFGHTCCPRGTTCFSEDFEIYSDGPGSLGFLPANFTALFNVTFLEDLCIPIEGQFFPVNFDLNNTNITENREPCGGVIGDLKPEMWTVTLPNITLFNTTKCGKHMCAENDTCIMRYFNGTGMNYTLNTSNPACIDYNPDPNFVNTWPPACTNVTLSLNENAHPVGCCPSNHTPCGPYPISFSPVEAELPQLWNPTMGMIGCVGPGETCCNPFICPVGMKCCSNKFTVNGTGPIYPANQTGRIVPDFLMGSVGEPGVQGLMIKFGQTMEMCCPENAYCCQIEVPYPKHYSPGGEFFSFCGVAPDCTLDAYKPDYLVYSEDLVGQAIQQTESLLDILSEGYITNVGSSDEYTCSAGYSGNKLYLRECGSLGGDYQNPPPTPQNSAIPPISGKFLPNTGFTEQINAEVVYNVTLLTVPRIPPRPP